MQEWEEKILEKRKARAEGLAEGRAEGLAEGLAEGDYFRLIQQIKKKIENPNLLSAQEIEEISIGLEKDVVDLKNDIKLIEKEFVNKEAQVADKNKYIAEMYPIIGASIISETLAHEIVRLSNNIKSYTKNIRELFGKNDESSVELNLKLIDSDIKFLARYASLLDVNSYSKRRKFEKLWVGNVINEILKK